MKFGLSSVVIALSLITCSAFADSTLVDKYIAAPGFSHIEISHWETSLYVSARDGSSTFGVQESLSSLLSEDLCKLADRTGIANLTNCLDNFEGTFGLEKSEVESLGLLLKQPGKSLFFENQNGKVVILDLPSYVPPSYGTSHQLAAGNTFAEAVLRLLRAQ